MNETVLEKARRYEAENGKKIPKESRPVFHLNPYVGWMNDPNGFSWYDGKYHMFYQYHPYSSQWGPMHWGHAVSEDLLHWHHCPAALAPDQPYDEAGCFSGTAITMPDGKQLLVYTGVHKEEKEDGTTIDIQKQCVAIGDGLNYEKYENNPVLTVADLPKGGRKEDFRDPKVFRGKNGTYYMIAVNRDETEGGQVLLFQSQDALHWNYVSKVAENHNRLGLMWECPDLFSMEDKDVLVLSAQEMLPEGLEFHNGFGTFALIGSYNEKTGQFKEETIQSLDYGLDFYAPQSILTPDGRRVMIGWMQNWDTVAPPQMNTRWAGQMSLPRELTMKNGKIYQNPVREILAYRCESPVCEERIICDEEIEIQGINGRVVDMTVDVEAENLSDIYHRFAIQFAKNDRFYTSISFRPTESVLRIDRKFSGSRRGIIHQRRSRVEHENGKIRLRLIIDRYSVEIFVNDGEQVLSAVMQTELSADRITFVASGAVKMKVCHYHLKEE
ncbi:MAG: glycoside hydrolase family 32 protein [Lachnospiraceae bacterium]|nr:glycoside hydrolase family 32 protein [Lachnospiraceae bacterium]